MRTGLLIFSLCLATALQLSIAQDESCTRGDGKTGYCVRRNQCAQFVSIINRRKLGFEYTADEVTYIRNSRCPGKKGFSCCEDEENVAPAISELASHNCGEFGQMKTIGGTEIELMSRPWMALLYLRNDLDEEGFFCGGTLINKRKLSVRLGEHNVSKEMDCTERRGVTICAPPVEDIEVDRVYVHEKYSLRSGHNDIALVKLARDVVFKESIRPICLPVSETLQQKVDTMEVFHVTGFGKTESHSYSDVPLETIVGPKDIAKCQKSYRRQIVSTQLCAGDRGKDSCNGDSGGPISYVEYFNGQQRFVQFGIVSFGSSSCGDGNPGVYTKVGSYIRWIAYKIATK
ncbi:hypothetical protein KR044_009497 [Drosophila immigrans]|nr:hypothetical protein KR044_009497 [Drosophila immigrans]